MPAENNIRRLQPADRSSIEAILGKIEIFSGEEVSVAMELIDIAINIPAQQDYHIFVLEQDNQVTGYHCTGKRPLTEGTYDLYWIVVDPERAGKGSGTLLLKHAENFVAERNGRWLLAETSSRSGYEKTREFYRRNNYAVLANIADFYAKDDALYIFGKDFSNKY